MSQQHKGNTLKDSHWQDVQVLHQPGIGVAIAQSTKKSHLTHNVKAYDKTLKTKQ